MPDKAVWTRFAREALVVGLAFFTVYPLCNWYSSRATVWHAMYLDAELSIPFVPEFAVWYLSMYLLFLLPPWFLQAAALKRLGKVLVQSTLISGAVFVLFPGKLGFARAVPAESIYSGFYAGLFSLDLPHNMVPSLHVVYSAAISFAIIEALRPGVRVWLFRAWLAAICLSTLLVHQHHLLDVVAGLALAWLIHNAYRGRKNNAENHHDLGAAAVGWRGAGGGAGPGDPR